jgi:iron uptake system component EfeO
VPAIPACLVRALATGAAVAVVAVLALTGCTDNRTGGTAEPGAYATPSGAGQARVTVTSTDTACHVSDAEAPSGNVVFTVTNGGSKVTEFYLLGHDGLKVIGEVENIGPGLTRDLVLRATPGNYFATCKPGMVGDGIRTDFKVTDSGDDASGSAAEADLIKAATNQYGDYVRSQAEQLVSQTKTFVTLYKAGNDDAARSVYANARMHWERIEPVAESFGDLDPKMDLREADLEEGQKWTGWHRIEKDLWPPASGYHAMTKAQRATMGNTLMADTQTLQHRTEDLSYTVDQIGNGAKELLDEVATGKVTGEEEAWSHTDLWDFQANLDGARVGFEGLRPALKIKNPALDKQIANRMSQLQNLLDQYRKGDGFVLYTALSKEQVKELSDAVNALSEPLSKLTAAVTL